MSATPVLPAAGPTAVLTTPATSSAWQIGTVLNALVLSPTTDGTTRLQIGARVVTAQTTLALQKGDSLQLQVEETGRTVVLKAQSRPTVMQQINSETRLQLPRQNAQTPLLATALAATKSTAVLPPELRQVIDRFSQSIPVATGLTVTKDLKSAVRSSGTFHEATVARGAETQVKTGAAQNGARPGSDWKATLIQLRGQLTQLLTTPIAAVKAQSVPLPLLNAPSAASVGNPATTASALPGADRMVSQTSDTTVSAPPMRHSAPAAQPVVTATTLPVEPRALVAQLLEQTDGALARVSLNQLASATPSADNKTVWLLELPVRHENGAAEVLSLKIEREDHGQDQSEESTWTMQLAFDLGKHGTLRSRVALRAERIYTSFFADQPKARDTVSARLDYLRIAMERQQLDVACLNCAAEQPVDRVPGDAQLLRERA